MNSSNDKKEFKMSRQTKELLSIAPGSSSGALVVDGDLQFAIRRWKKSLKQNGKLKELYDRREYVKPSARRRRTKSDAIYRQTLVKNEAE